MKKIATVIGARPQFVKMAMVSRELRSRGIKEIVVHTGQHYDKCMSGIFFKELRIPAPDYNLGIGSARHGEQTARMLQGIERILVKEKPALVLVYGDTNSTLAGALAASKLNIPAAHIEAGLRSYNNRMPEEINRIVADSVSELLFCPTAVAVNNLKKEGRRKGVYLVGDVMYDSIKKYRRDIDKVRLPGIAGNRILCTIHRAENTDNPANLRQIFSALAGLESEVLIPLHPRTAGYLKKYGIKVGGNIRLVKPVGYIEMLKLEKDAPLVITDSGGVQKEAFIFGVPCVTLRNETEWTETVRSGMNSLVGASGKKLAEAVKRAAAGPRRRIDPEKVYGDGTAHKKIVDILEKHKG